MNISSHCLRICRSQIIQSYYTLKTTHHISISYRCLTTSAAKAMLGFSEDDKFSLRELRHAYFEAAKRYHPDVIAEGDDLEFDFKDITDAYEHLLSGDSNDDTTPQYSKEEMDNIVTLSEEEEYRQACRDQLGLPAEIVEESKSNPMFRKWLTGNTDAAHYWRMFLTGHGGLAQKLRPQQYLNKGNVAAPKKSETRRKKKR